MTTKTVNLVVKVPESLRRRLRTIARSRGETVSQVVREALFEYVAAGEKEATKIDEEALEKSDADFARSVLDRIAQGAPTYSHEEIWTEIRRLEEEGTLPD